MVAPNETVNFTKATIAGFPTPPAGKRYAFKDARMRGLIVRVTANGKRTFQLYQKHLGRPVRITLGSFPDMTVQQARAEAARAKGALAAGTNPNVEKNRIRQEITLRELFHLYMERYSKVEKKSWRYDEREINKFLPHWFNRKISDISKYEIKSLHLRTRERNGLYQANRILERIRAMYNKAIEWGWDGQNPSNGIKKFKEQSRDRFVRPDEMPLLLQAINNEESEVARDYFLILLFTGARKTNVLQMRWEEIDWHNKTWRIPDTKNGEPVVLPLSQRAEEILGRRLRASNGDPWVFPSESSKQGHLVDPKKAWNRIKQTATIGLWATSENTTASIRKAIFNRDMDSDVGNQYRTILEIAQAEKVELPTGLMDVRIHDIRRTFGSYQAMSGASLQIIGESLGHKSQQTTQVYARLQNDPIRASIDTATEAIVSLGYAIQRNTREASSTG